MKKILFNGVNSILFGGDYNPEQWLDEKDVIWQEDMRLMKLACANEMTVGIFAWSTLEPEEGKFDFSYMEEILDLINANGGKVILATPSGARPRWLAEKYPEVLRVGFNGERDRFGVRHNHCYTSPAYREKVRTIDEEIAKRFGNHPAVIGWHISNEFGGECRCPLCVNAFRKWLKEKYGTVKALNKAWWATFWSHTYDSFDQVEPFFANGENSISALQLDWKRFVTYQSVDFMKTEIQAIKKYSDKPVTTNLMTIDWPDYDDYKYGEAVDFLSWDNYPDWGDPALTNYEVSEESAFLHDLYRSMKKQPFVLMENAPGVVNWKTYCKIKRPGIDRLQAMQAVAHGSDGVMYFQFRKSRGSCEQFHGAFVDHVGNENTRVFKTLTGIGKELKNLSQVVGTTVDSEVAVVFGWENKWALQGSQCMTLVGDKGYAKTCMQYHKILRDLSINTDVISEKADFSGYKLIILPMQFMVDEDLEKKIVEFVKGGGTVLATYALGMVNETDLCHLGGFPCGKLKEVFGVWNEEIDTLYKGETVKIKTEKREYVGKDFCEIIHLKGAEIIATYGSEFYAGEPCATVNAYGDGKAYYQAFRDDGEFSSDLLEKICGDLELKRNLPTVKRGVCATTRTDGETEFLFVMNFNDEKVEGVSLGGEFTSVTLGKVVSSVDLSPLAVEVFSRRKY